MTSTNASLRSARERTASKLHAGECLSRQELAEAVNTHLWHQHAQRVELDGHYIAKLERGVIRWPNSRYRAALRAVLGAGDDAELGFRAPRRGVVPVPGRLVTPWDVDQVNQAARTIVRGQHQYGGWWMRDAALAQLRSSAGLLDGECPAELARPLRQALGDFAHVCAFMCFDTGEHDEARGLFDLALRYADLAGDEGARANALASLSRQATWLGRPDEGLTFADQALVAADRLTAARRAMLFAARARALGALGRVEDTVRAVGLADEHMSHADPELEPPSMRFYDARQHSGDTGEALAYLAALGHRVDDARTRMRVAFDDGTDSYARSRLLAQVKLASLAMTTGEPVEGALLGVAAAQESGSVRSDRVLDSFRMLDGHARRYRGLGAVAELRDELRRTCG